MSWTLTTSGAAISKGGVNANSTITASGATLAKWSDDAEASLNLLTRKDWVAGYSSITANYKGVLSETVSDMIGIQIIEYDKSGYTSRYEADGMADFLRDRITRNLTALQEKDNQEVMD